MSAADKKTGRPVFKDRSLFFLFCWRGSPDLPAKTSDRTDNKDDKQDSAEDIFCNIRPDRNIHAHPVIEHADKQRYNQKENEPNDDSKDDRRCKPQNAGSGRRIIHKIHGKSVNKNLFTLTISRKCGRICKFCGGRPIFISRQV